MCASQPAQSTDNFPSPSRTCVLPQPPESRGTVIDITSLGAYAVIVNLLLGGRRHRFQTTFRTFHRPHLPPAVTRDAETAALRPQGEKLLRVHSPRGFIPRAIQLARSILRHFH